jgi:hypothetical protein
VGTGDGPRTWVRLGKPNALGTGMVPMPTCPRTRRSVKNTEPKRPPNRCTLHPEATGLHRRPLPQKKGAACAHNARSGLTEVRPTKAKWAGGVEGDLAGGGRAGSRDGGGGASGGSGGGL